MCLRRVDRLLACLGVIIILLTGCSGEKSSERLEGVKVDFSIAPNPPSVGPAKATVRLTDRDGKALPGAALKLEGNMNHAGMKPVFADAKEMQPGVYEGTLELTMGGDWFVLITGKLADGRSLKEKVDVPGVKSR
jgi:hypothetical protein